MGFNFLPMPWDKYVASEEMIQYVRRHGKLYVVRDYDEDNKIETVVTMYVWLGKVYMTDVRQLLMNENS